MCYLIIIYFVGWFTNESGGGASCEIQGDLRSEDPPCSGEEALAGDQVDPLGRENPSRFWGEDLWPGKS